MPVSAEDLDFAPGVIPQEGEVLQGEVTELSRRTTVHGQYPVVTYTTDVPVQLKEGTAKAGDTVAWHVTDTVARNQLADLKLQVGQRFAALFTGWVRRPEGADYKGWRCKLTDATAPAFDWGDNGAVDAGEVKVGAPLEEGDDTPPW